MVNFLMGLLILCVLGLFIWLPFYLCDREEWNERITGWFEQYTPDSHVNRHKMIDKTVTHGNMYTNYHWKCTCGYSDSSIFKSVAKSNYMSHRISMRKIWKGKGEW